jgi:Methylmalonic aciduria and homocystinuria type D protein
MADGSAAPLLLDTDTLQIGMHTDLPKSLVRELRLVFPGRDVQAVLTVAQRAAHELVKWDEEVDREKDELLEKVRGEWWGLVRESERGRTDARNVECSLPPLRTASVTFWRRRRVCGLTSSTPARDFLYVEEGWGGIREGWEMSRMRGVQSSRRERETNTVYAEVDSFALLLHYRTSDAGGCKILLHPTWGSRVYPASIMAATADESLLREAVAHALASPPADE